MRIPLPLKDTRNRGFTLAELVIVLAIMGIFAGIIFPNFHTTNKNRQLENALIQVQNDLRWAQQQAKQEGRVITTYFLKPREGRCYYRIYGDSSETLRRRYFSPEVWIDLVDTNMTRFAFKGDGTLVQNGRLVLTNGKKKGYVYGFQTGRVRISYIKNSE